MGFRLKSRSGLEIARNGNHHRGTETPRKNSVPLCLCGEPFRGKAPAYAQPTPFFRVPQRFTFMPRAAAMAALAKRHWSALLGLSA